MPAPTRLFRDHSELDAWPVVADAFLAILCVVVFQFAGVTAPDPGKVQFVERLRNTLQGSLRAGDLLVADVSESTVRLVYSADRLSFAQCEWAIGAEQAGLLHSHLRLFQPRADLVERIRIEGHADRDSVYKCRGLVPYRDNLQLSQNRARAVLNILLGLPAGATEGLDELLWSKDVPPAPEGLEYIYQLTKEGKVVVAGSGASIPLNPADPKDPKNRRVELVISLLSSPGTQQ